jgi:signal transduction histidine kinase
VIRIGVQPAPLWIIGLSILLYNLVLFLASRQAQAPPKSSQRSATFRLIAFTQMTLDWLAIALLIHFSGGIQSPVTLFFVFHIVIAAMFFTRRVSFAFTALAIVLLGGVVCLEYFGLIAHFPIGPHSSAPIYSDPVYVVIVLLFYTSTLVIVTYLVTSISDRLRRREIEILRLTETLRQSSARLQALNDSAQTLNSTLDFTQVLNRLVENIAKVMGVRACSIRLLNEAGTHLEVAAAYGLSQEYLNKGPVILESSPLAQEILSGKTVNIAFVQQREIFQYPDSIIQEGIHSMISSPLIGKSRALGILRAYSDEPDHFNEEDEAFLSAIAAQGSIAIENALAYKTIETLDATKAAFIRVFTHELRSPVSVTRSLLQTIISGYAGQVTSQQKDILERAARRVDFLSKLIDDLLDLANGRAPQVNLASVAPVALEEVVENVVSRFEAPAREKGLSLEWRLEKPDNKSFVKADLESLDRIFNNLVSNAVKYTPNGGKVTITIDRQAKEVSVSVQDTGIGIPEDAIPHLYEEFFRAPNARSIEHQGTGLGLAIVHETVNNLGGRITVQSQTGVGSCFTVHLPLAASSET